MVIPYLLLYALVAVPALFGSRKPNRVLWAFVWVIFVLFIGLRERVGGDWYSYLYITDQISLMRIGEAVLQQEFLFSLITWASTHLGLGIYGSNLIGAIIFCGGLFAFCLRQDNPWLALAAATPFLVIVAAMSANRQGMEIGVVLLTMAHWEKLGLLKRSLGILLASLFHVSAIFLLMLTVIDLEVSRWKKTLLLLLVAAGSIFLAMQADEAWHRYTVTYVQQPEGVYSPGAVLHLLQNFIPAVLMLASRRLWVGRVPNWQLIRQLALMALAFALLVPFFTVAVGRMSLYLFPVSIVFFSHLPKVFRGVHVHSVVRLGTLSLLGISLLLWLMFANTAHMYVPYQNVIFARAGWG